MKRGNILGENVDSANQLRTAVVIFFDQDTGKVLNSTQVQGQPGQIIAFNAGQRIAGYLTDGYSLIANGLPEQARYQVTDYTQKYAVILKHRYLQIDLQHGKQPSFNRINVPQAEYLKLVTQTVYFVTNTGAVITKANQQQAKWTRPLTVDAVDGRILNPDSAWQPQKEKYDDVKAPLVNGYFADQAVVDGGQPTLENVTKKITYRPLGKIIPVDEEGHLIGHPVRYQNDPANPTKALADEALPTIKGYKTPSRVVTPSDPGKDTLFHYQLDLKTAIFQYVDEVSGQVLATDKVQGEVGTAIDYQPQERLTSFIQSGYQVVENPFEVGNLYSEGTNDPQQFKIILTHQYQLVGTNQPQESGALINPGDPESPTWPSSDEYQHDFSFTVNFINFNGQRLAKDQVQSSHWTRTVKVDKVTGKIVEPAAQWHSDTRKYQSIPVPVIDGYYTNRENLLHPRAIPFNMRYTLVYYQLGRLIPVDTNHQPIADAPTPQYQNDPLNPTSATYQDIIPVIDGYTADPVAPIDDWGEDTEVVYRKDPSEDDQRDSSTAFSQSAVNNDGENPDEEPISEPTVAAQSDNNNVLAFPEPSDQPTSKVETVTFDQAPLENAHQAPTPEEDSATGFWGQLTSRLKKRSRNGAD